MDVLISSGCSSNHLIYGDEGGKMYLQGYSVDHEIGYEVPHLIGSISAGDTAEIATGRYHSIFLLRNGSVCGLGGGFRGQFGNGSKEVLSEPKKLEIFEKGVNIAHVTCGDDFTYFLTTEGRVLCCGSNRFGQLGQGNEIDQFSVVSVDTQSKQRVTRISCGYAHVSLIYEDGTVFMCGSNEYGQLGVSDYSRKLRFTKVEKYGLKFKDVACGMYFTAFLTVDGAVYTCGGCHYGQLGHGNKINLATPTLVDYFEKKSEIVTRITCGNSHCFCVTQSRSLVSFGSNEYCQLGRKDEDCSSPKNVEFFDSKDILNVFCTSEDTFVLTQAGDENMYELHGFGKNECGIVGNNTRDVQATPEVVAQWKCKGDTRVKEILVTADSMTRDRINVPRQPQISTLDDVNKVQKKVLPEFSAGKEVDSDDISEILAKARDGHSALESTIWKLFTEKIALEKHVEHLQLLFTLQGNSLDEERRMRIKTEQEIAGLRERAEKH